MYLEMFAVNDDLERKLAVLVDGQVLDFQKLRG